MRHYIYTLKNLLRSNKDFVLGFASSFTLVIVVFSLLFYFRGDLFDKSKQEEVHSPSAPMESASIQEETNIIYETDANGNILSDMDFTYDDDELSDDVTFDAEGKSYLIKVNRAANCVTVYTEDSNGEFTIPVKAMACSTGKYKGNTPLGTFSISNRYTWRLMVDNTHSQYATRIYGGILFHSVPCYRPRNDQLEVEEFNKLGSPASLGCVRLTVADSKWIHDYCGPGTTVIIYDDEDNPGPLGKPEVIKIPTDAPYRGWDPTDTHYANPWNVCQPVIFSDDVIDVVVGSDFNLMKYVLATDTCGNDITSTIRQTGTFDIHKIGKYQITLSVTDLLKRSARKSITINVVSADTVRKENTVYDIETYTYPETVVPYEYKPVQATTSIQTTATTPVPTDSSVPVTNDMTTSPQTSATTVSETTSISETTKPMETTETSETSQTTETTETSAFETESSLEESGTEDNGTEDNEDTTIEPSNETSSSPEETTTPYESVS